MILVLTGQERYPFDRLLAMVDEGVGRGIIPGPVLAQTGWSRHAPDHLRAEAFLPAERLGAIIRESDAVITHAGVGSILMILEARKVPIIVPRRSDLKEHVDDHQVELACRLQEIGRARVAQDAGELFELFRNGSWRDGDRGKSAGGAAGSALVQGLGSIIAGIAGPSARPSASSIRRG
jgi:UDP-N-acetylglucosamine transferase subunit ALG13